MTGEQTLIAILGVAALIGGASIFKAWLNKLSTEKDSEIKIELSKQETECLKVVMELAKSNQALANS